MRKALIGALALPLLSGCGGERAQESEVRSKAVAEPVALKVDPVSQAVTTKDEVTVQGHVTPGSRVVVDGAPASVSGGRFRARIPLKPGSNPIDVIARRPGYRATRDRVGIKRRKPAPAAVPTQTTPTAPQPQAQPNVNPRCPPGTEPNATGGCDPYDERDGQIEPKINDPRCYSDRPPAGCF
jgi:hypothetical protein